MNRTCVDWWAFRSKAGVERTFRALRGAFGPSGAQLTMTHRGGGWMGYDESAALHLQGMGVGLLAWGGAAQRDWVMGSLSGAGCRWIGDEWDRAQSAVDELPSYQARRVDIALDTSDRSVTHDAVVQAHRSGMFTTRGRPPSMRQLLPEDPTEGRTVYIGNRERPKFLRGYEKGYELAQQFPKGLKPESINGVPIGDMYRLELELKAKDGPLPEDLIDRRDQYFAGSYPYLHHVLQCEPEIFVQRREHAPQLDLQAALANIRHQYGRTLFTALAAYHGDFFAVWDRVVGNQHHADLVEAGVLLVDHES